MGVEVGQWWAVGKLGGELQSVDWEISELRAWEKENRYLGNLNTDAASQWPLVWKKKSKLVRVKV